MTVISTTPILTDYWEADRRTASAIREVLSNADKWPELSESEWEQFVIPGAYYYTTDSSNGNKKEIAKSIVADFRADLESAGYIGYTQNGFYYIEKVDNND